MTHLSTQPPPADLRFRTAVAEHANLVYAAALRQLRNPAAADDATQAVFLVLLRKRAQLPADRPLGPWLLTVTRYVCKDVRKAEGRRRRHERSAAMSSASPPPSVDHADVGHLLDDALARLPGHERDALTLRYLQGLDVPAVAAALAVPPDTARKRITRGLARLRDYFTRHHIDPAAGAAALSAAATITAPAQLASALAVLTPKSASAAAVSLAGSASHSLWIAAVKIPAALAALAIAAGVGGALVLDARPPAPTTPIAATATAWIPAAPVPPPLGAITGAQAAGGPKLVDFHLLADRRLATALIDASTPLPTDSTGFTARQGDTETIRKLIADAADTPLFDDSVHVYDGTYSGMLNGTRTFTSGGEAYAMVTDGTFDLRAAPTESAVECRITTPTPFTISIGRGALKTSATGTIAANGLLPLGKTTLFILPLTGDFDAPSYIRVQQAERLTEYQASFVGTLGTARFIAAGAAHSRWLSNREFLWRESRAHDLHDGPARWRRQVGDAVVRLVALAPAADRRGALAWTPDGQPFAGVAPGIADFTLEQTPGAHLVAGIIAEDLSAPADQRRLSDDGRRFAGSHGIIHEALPLSPQRRRVSAGLGEGEWTRIATFPLPGDRSVDAHGIPFRTGNGLLFAPKDQSFIPTLDVSYSDSAGEELRTAAVDKSGKEHPPTRLLTIPLANHDTSRAGVQQKDSYLLKRDEIGHLVLYSRPRQWVTFEGFAETPVAAPPADCSDEAVAAAVSARQARRRADALAQPDTPAAALFHMADAVAAGDQDKTEASFLATSDDERAFARDATRAFIAAHQLRTATRRHFGPARTQEIADDPAFQLGLEALADKEWTLTSDHAAVHGLHLTRTDGRWRIDARTQDHGGHWSAANLRAAHQSVQRMTPALLSALEQLNAGKLTSPRHVLQALRASSPPSATNPQ